jgi:hypothetical protein
VAQQAAQSARQPSTLPPRPDPNPKDVKTVQHTLRSGVTYEDPPIPTNDHMPTSEEAEQQKNDEQISVIEDQVSKDSPRSSVIKDVPTKVSTEVPRYVPLHKYAPFPSRLSKDNNKTKKQFSKFIDVLKQLYINLPLTEVIT